MNGGKEGEIESGRSAELENCGHAEVEDHLRKDEDVELVGNGYEDDYDC